MAETFLVLLPNRSFSLRPSYFSPSPLFLSLAGKPIAQLVTRTNSLFRLSLFPTFRIGRQWSQREMAGRVLRLGRKAEVDKRQSGIGQRRVEARNEKWKGTGVIREWRRRAEGKRKKGREKEETGRMRDGMLEDAHATGRGFTAKVSQGRRYIRSTSEQTDPNRSIDPEPAARFLPIFFSLSSPYFLLSFARGTVRRRSLKL